MREKTVAFILVAAAFSNVPRSKDVDYDTAPPCPDWNASISSRSDAGIGSKAGSSQSTLTSRRRRDSAVAHFNNRWPVTGSLETSRSCSSAGI